MRRHGFGFGLVVAVVVLSNWVLSGSQAMARISDDCQAPGIIAFAQPATTIHGVTSHVRFTDRETHNLCGNPTQFWPVGSGVRFYLGSSQQRYIELGWTMERDVPGEWFFYAYNQTTELGCSFLESCFIDPQVYPCAVANGYGNFRITNDPVGSQTWRFWFWCDGHSKVNPFSNLTNTGYTTGQGSVLTWRTAGTVVGMSDLQTQQQYRASDGSWKDWTSASNVICTASNWDGDWTANPPTYSTSKTTPCS